MSEAASAFSAWSNFYVIIGSSAAALTGLMFVTVTLVAGFQNPGAEEGTSTFSTPTVVHFGTALLVSAVISAPWHSIVYAAAILAVAGISGVAYIGRITYRTARQGVYDPDLDDWIWYSGLPLVSYLTIAIAAFLLTSIRDVALFALAGATLLLIFIGIRNAWDIVTYVAFIRARSQDADTRSRGENDAAATSTPREAGTVPSERE
jgi:hypothetical protein